MSESDRSDSGSGSPSVEVESFSWGLEGTLGDDSLMVAIIYLLCDSQIPTLSPEKSLRNHLLHLRLPLPLRLSLLPSPLVLQMVKSYCSKCPHGSLIFSPLSVSRYLSFIHNREEWCGDRPTIPPA
jgi:hypothetical protein